MEDAREANAPGSSMRAGTLSLLREKLFSPPAAVLFCFLFSVVVRVPHLDRPLSDHHEWLTAQTLVSLDNWRTQGALDHNFALLQTYPSPADRFAKGPLIKLFATDGKGYYTSFPPLAVILPYLLFSALSIEPTALSLQIFNLVGHLVASLFFYRLLCLVLSRGPAPRRAAAVGTAAFILAAPNPWYFSNVYSWDTFWHYPWIIAMFFVLRIDEAAEHSRSTRGPFILFGIAAFAAAYSEHQGTLFCALVALWGFSRRKKSRAYTATAAIAVAAAAAALGLMLYQYVSQVGLDAFIQTTSGIVSARSGKALRHWPHIVLHYLRGADYFLLPFFAMSAVWLIRVRRGEAWNFHRPGALLAYLVLSHVVIHALVFTQWTSVHDYSIVKSMVFFAALLGWLFQKAFTSDVPRLARAVVLIALFVGGVDSLSRYESHFASSEKLGRYRELGLAIGSAADESETVFTVADDLMVPQVVYYARRNPQGVRDREEALNWMKRHGRERGRLFHIDQDMKVVRMETLRR